MTAMTEGTTSGASSRCGRQRQARRHGWGARRARCVAGATAAAATLAAAWLAFAPAAQAQGEAAAKRRGPATPAALAQASPEQLKAAYLQCDRLVRSAPLEAGTAATCSVIYETLKQRVFDGDFHRLLAWSRTQSSLPAAVPATAASAAGRGDAAAGRRPSVAASAAARR
ncbi:MAG: hypothetical protein KIT17_16340 [Rubrivivax sp.]|nr:hypothetical protein [Rubrivivax sp.]